MNSKKLAAYIQLGRPVNVLITFVSIPAACWIAGGTASLWGEILLAGLTGAFVAAGANAINDAFDIEIDRINRPDRPLPRGHLTVRDARTMWLIVSMMAVGINIFLNSAALMIVVLSVMILYVYSARLKRTVLIGNVLVGIMTGMAFLYGGVVAGRMDHAYVPALFAFLVNLAREILKDIEDIEGDRKEHAVTLPLKYGVIPALVIATASLMTLIGSTMAVAVSGMYHPAFLYLVIVADGLMSVSILFIWRDHSSRSLNHASTLLKGSMIAGLLSVIAGSM